MNKIELSRNEFRAILVFLSVVPVIAALLGVQIGKDIEPAMISGQAETIAKVEREVVVDDNAPKMANSERVITPEPVSDEHEVVAEASYSDDELSLEAPVVEVEAPVQVAVPRLSQPHQRFAVQIGLFKALNNAQRFQASLEKNGLHTQIISDDTYHRVVLAIYDEREQADTAAQLYKQYYHGEAYVRILPEVVGESFAAG